MIMTKRQTIFRNAPTISPHFGPFVFIDGSIGVHRGSSFHGFIDFKFCVPSSRAFAFHGLPLHRASAKSVSSAIFPNPSCILFFPSVDQPSTFTINQSQSDSIPKMVRFHTNSVSIPYRFYTRFHAGFAEKTNYPLANGKCCSHRRYKISFVFARHEILSKVRFSHLCLLPSFRNSRPSWVPQHFKIRSDFGQFWD